MRVLPFMTNFQENLSINLYFLLNIINEFIDEREEIAEIEKNLLL